MMKMIYVFFILTGVYRFVVYRFCCTTLPKQLQLSTPANNILEKPIKKKCNAVDFNDRNTHTEMKPIQFAKSMNLHSH